MPKYQLQLTGDQVAQLLALIQAIGGKMEEGESLLTPEQQQLLQEKVDDGRITSLAELLDFMDGIGEGQTLQSLLENAKGLSDEDKELLEQVRKAIADGDLISDEVVEQKVQEYLDERGTATDSDILSIFGKESEPASDPASNPSSPSDPSAPSSPIDDDLDIIDGDDPVDDEL